MSRVIGLAVLLCLAVCVAIASGAAAAAKEVPVLGLGSVTIPAEVEASDITFNGDKGTGLLVKDGAVWRSCVILCLNDATTTVTDIAKTPSFFRAIFEGASADDGKLIRVDDMNALTIGGYKALNRSAVLYVSGQAFNMDIYVLPKGEGSQLVMCVSADGDAQYWRPFYVKMLNTLQQ